VALVKINRHPSPRQLRQFGAVSVLFLSGFAAVAVWYRTPMAATGLLLLALAAASLAWLAPHRLRAWYLLLSYAAFPIGLCFGLLGLLLVYFLVVTPIGLVLRWAGHDSMSRRWEAARASYWSQRFEPEDSVSYYRQF